MTVDVVDGVARIILNRPDYANAVDLSMARAFGVAVDRIEADDVRSVVIEGAGPRFCAGGDVTSFLASGRPQDYLLELATVLESHIRRLSTLPKPVMAAVRGAAAGAGLAFVLASDIVVSAPDAKYTMAYANIGLTPDCGVSYLLPRVVGLRRAVALTLERRTLTAAEALEWGLVSSISDDPATAAHELATTIARGPAEALGRARRLLRTSFDLPRDAHAADESATIAAAVAEPEAQRLIRAFTQR